MIWLTRLGGTSIWRAKVACVTPISANDLGLTMGILPSEWNDEHTAMIQHILDKCQEHGVPWGMFTSTYEIAEYWLERGGLIATVGADLGFLMSGLAAMDARVRDLVARVNAG